MTEAERKDVENCICSLLTSNPIRMTIGDLNRDFRNMIGYSIPFRKFGFNNLEAYLRSISHRVLVLGSGNFAEVRVIVSQKTAHINDLICKQKVNKNPRAVRNGLRKYVTPRVWAPPPHHTEYNKNKPDMFANPRQTSTPQKLENKPYSEDEDTPVPYGVQKKLKDLILEYPKGVLCSKIPGLYMQKYHHTLDYVQYGYRSVSQLCLDMPSAFKYQHCDNGDLRVFDSLATIPEKVKSQPETPKPSTSVKKSQEKQNTEAALPDNVDDILLNFHKQNLPEGCAIIHDIPRQWIAPQVHPFDYVDVNVADVYDPSKFWIHLKEHSDELDELMDDMQEFYQTKKIEYQVPVYALKDDLYVACMFSKEYHRAKIIDTSKKLQSIVKVFFVDYGTVATVYTTGLLYLDKAFVELPAQAIRARLHGVQPVVKDEFWSREAALRFLELVKEKEHLVAQIMWIDNAEFTLDIVLADTSIPDEDFYVNDALVAEGYGKFLDETQDEPKIKDYVPTVQCIHLFPTHNELETGAAPNLYLMVVLEQTNVPLDALFPQYFTKTDTISNKSNTVVDSPNQTLDNEISWADLQELEEQNSSKNVTLSSPSDNNLATENLENLTSEFKDNLMVKEEVQTDEAVAENHSATEENHLATHSATNRFSGNFPQQMRPPPGFPALPRFPMNPYPGQQINPQLLMLCSNSYRYSVVQNRYHPMQADYNNFFPPMAHFYKHNFPHPQYFQHYMNQVFVGHHSPPMSFPPQHFPHTNHPENSVKPEEQTANKRETTTFPHIFSPENSFVFKQQDESPNKQDKATNDHKKKTILTMETLEDGLKIDDTNHVIENDTSFNTESPKQVTDKLNLPQNVDIENINNIKTDTNLDRPETCKQSVNERLKSYIFNVSERRSLLSESENRLNSCNGEDAQCSSQTTENNDENPTNINGGGDGKPIVELTILEGLQFHILNIQNKRFVYIKELLECLFGAALPSHIVRRKFSTSPPFVDIISINLSDNAQLAEELLRCELIKENTESIDIVSIDDSEHVVTVLKRASDNVKCETYLSYVKTVM